MSGAFSEDVLIQQSNSSIGADAGYNYDKNFIHLPRQYLPERQRAVHPAENRNMRENLSGKRNLSFSFFLI